MMKSKLSFAALALICAAGCTQGTPGGPGVQAPTGTQAQQTNKPIIGEARDTFSLRTPMLATSVKQGESKSVSIAINRGNDFDDDVQLSFSELPTGVTLDPANPTLAKSDKEIKFNVDVGSDAAIGEFTVKVTGHPGKGGPDAVNQFKLNISQK